jgi:hypothetical protein
MLNKDLLSNPENTDKTSTQIKNNEEDSIIEGQEGALTPLRPNPIDPSIFQAREMIKEAVQEATGLSDSARGDITGATATEVREAGSSTQIVLNDTAKKLRRGIVNTMTKLLAVEREYGPDYRIVPVFGSRNEWAEYKRTDLAGDYQISIELPLPGDKQNDLNNAINARHEMANSENIQGEGRLRLDQLVLRKLGLEPELYITGPPVDAVANVEKEHRAMMQGQLVEPQVGEEVDYHLEQHDSLASDLERQMGVLAMIQDPQVLPLAQQQMQIIQQQLQVVMQHIQMTHEIEPDVPQGRRRNALVFPTGNPGTAESVLSNEIQGT